MIAVPCKEPVAGGRTGVMVDFIGTRRLTHKFEVDSQDESSRRRIAKFKKL